MSWGARFSELDEASENQGGILCAKQKQLLRPIKRMQPLLSYGIIAYN